MQFSAFGTLALTTTDSDTYGYRKDVSYDKGVFSGDLDLLSHSLIGGQVNVGLSNEFDFVGQAVIKDMAKKSLDNYLTMAFLRYAPKPEWAIRVGRTAIDIFLITEYRDIGIANPWATVPNEVYSIIPFRFVDGADINYQLRLNEGTLTSKIFTGKSDSYLSTSNITEKIQVDNILGASVSYDKSDWIIQARYSAAQLANETQSTLALIGAINTVPVTIWPNASSFSQTLRVLNTNIKYLSLSYQQYFNRWLLTTEFSQVKANDSPVIPTINSGYLGLSYQFDQYTIYGVSAFSQSDNYQFNETNVIEAAIPELINAVEGNMNFYATNQNTISLGLRWDISANMALSLQWSHSNIKQQGGTLWIDNSDNSPKDHVNTLLLSMSFSL
ncbi:hypothetical protein [Thalassotalea sp. G2M2-11]|uniref:hypothetical protein n=1 Tax=Thalassotalea sp. G2M2-11 TaxID=2787627 RepID=UPI0019D0EDE7|nr:hypothetical protein [Thalassotalea sp. G2M2-11]